MVHDAGADKQIDCGLRVTLRALHAHSALVHVQRRRMDPSSPPSPRPPPSIPLYDDASMISPGTLVAVSSAALVVGGVLGCACIKGRRRMVEPSQRYAPSEGRRSRVQSPDTDTQHTRRSKTRNTAASPMPTGGGARAGEKQQGEGDGVPLLNTQQQDSPERDPADDYWLPPWEPYSGLTLATAAAAIISTNTPDGLSRAWTRWLRRHQWRLWRRELVALVRAALLERDLSRAMTTWCQTLVQSLRQDRDVLKNVLLDAKDRPDPSLERGGPTMRSPSRLPHSLSQPALSKRSPRPHLAPLQLEKRFTQHQTSQLRSTPLLDLPPASSLTHYMQAGAQAQAQAQAAGAQAGVQATSSPHRVMHRIVYCEKAAG